MILIKGKFNSAICFCDEVEENAKEEILAICNRLEFSDNIIRIMPDVHAGMGCTIGTTMLIKNSVVPAMVGVDIGCGMLTVKLGKVNIDLQSLDEYIHLSIPSGREVHQHALMKFEDITNLKCYRELRDTRKFNRAIGTLGGGNHFIEVDIDREDNKYLVIHSGSRNLGHQVATYYQNLAYDLIRGKGELLKQQGALIIAYKAEGRRDEIQAAIVELRKKFKLTETDLPKELAFLTGDYMLDYLHDMNICQRYAEENRFMMAKLIVEKIRFGNEELFETNPLLTDSFTTMHNYIEISKSVNILRKGAVSARDGEKLLIPINMRDGSLICIGKGNEDWNYSAPHGAGRIMGRKVASATLDMEEYKRSMRGIFTTSVNEKTLDEAPMAYKSIDAIVNNIEPTAKIIAHIKPIYNFKASE